MDTFHGYLKKQLLEYVESERKKGVPLEQIEKVLADAGHGRNIIDEIMLDFKKEDAGKKVSNSDPVEKDLASQLKNAFSQFMASASDKNIEKAKKDIQKTGTDEIVKAVIEEAEVIEEKIILESAIFFLYIAVFALIVLLTAGATDAGVINVIIGFLPAIISIIISFL